MNSTNFTKETRQAMLSICTTHPRILPKIDQTRQYLELFCAKEKISIIDVFY